MMMAPTQLMGPGSSSSRKHQGQRELRVQEVEMGDLNLEHKLLVVVLA